MGNSAHSILRQNVIKYWFELPFFDCRTLDWKVEKKSKGFSDDRDEITQFLSSNQDKKNYVEMINKVNNFCAEIRTLRIYYTVTHSNISKHSLKKW